MLMLPTCITFVRQLVNIVNEGPAVYMAKKKNNSNRKHNPVVTLLLNLLAMAVVAVLAAFFTFRWLDSYTNHNEAYMVPDVRGMQLDEAITVLAKQNLGYAVQEYKYKAGAKMGEVLEQSPKTGALVKEDRKIYLVLNTTEAPKFGIPPVIDNCSLREAQFRLKAAGFVVKEIEFIPGEREWVYGVTYDGIELKNGAAIPRGSKVTLVVGNGNMTDEDTVMFDANFF